MNRRAFLTLAATAAGGILFFAGRAFDYWLTRQRVAQIETIPALPALPTPIDRAAWGARDVNHDAPNESGFSSPDNPTGWHTYPADLSGVYHTVAVHHNALARRRGETMRSIQDFHMTERGWADIGYHFAIDPQGMIYIGRDIHVRGASIAGGNTGVIGVVVMGHFEWENPTDAQLIALQTLVNQLANIYNLTTLAGHSELNPADTVCPGRFMRLYLDLLARGAGLQRPV